METRLNQLKNFLQESPDDTFLKYALTMEYLKLGNHKQAQIGFEDLISNDPEYIGTYYHFGKFLEQQGNKELAISIYNQGMELAQKKRNFHALGELKNAYMMASGLLDDEDE